MTDHAILGLTPSQRRELFEAAEHVITLRAAMIEKDFWVCWTLGRLFSLPDAREHFIFKGGHIALQDLGSDSSFFRRH